MDMKQLSLFDEDVPAPTAPPPGQIVLPLFAGGADAAAPAAQEAAAVREAAAAREPAHATVAAPASGAPGLVGGAAAGPGGAAAAVLPAGDARLARAARASSFYLEIERFSDLGTLQAFAMGCQRCGLRSGCRTVVFGEGDPHARVMLVGEGPGATEDELGRPFVGRAGELLDRILKAAGFEREEVYITNVVMCRPPGNRTPTDEEMAACRPYLERKIDLVNPAIIVALGSTAARALLGPDARITRVRGTWHAYGPRRIMPTYHPAALLRDPSKKPAAWEDFQKVRNAYRALRRSHKWHLE